MNSINDPSRHGEPNKQDEKDATCHDCGEELDGEVFIDAQGEKVCGECMAHDFTELVNYKYKVAYVDNRTFKICEDK